MLADPSFYSDAYLNFSSYLGSPSATFSFALFTLWLATVQNWMLVALEKASLHRCINSAPAVDSLPYHHLTTSSVWNGGKWSRDINQVLWLVVCRSAQKRMSDDSTQSGCVNKEHQTNYSQSGGANSHSVTKYRRVFDLMNINELSLSVPLLLAARSDAWRRPTSHFWRKSLCCPKDLWRQKMYRPDITALVDWA